VPPMQSDEEVHPVNQKAPRTPSCQRSCWEQVSLDLGVVLSEILDEFSDMCRKSKHDREAQDVLTRLEMLSSQAS
jgi:hypothetical protein